MDHQTVTEVRKHIDPQEKILWSGRPQQGIVFRGSDIFLVPFSLLWGGFAFFWEYAVIAWGAPPFFALFGIPFVVIGIYLIAGRFYVDTRQREKIFYAVTPERILIISGWFQRKARFLSIRALQDVSIAESANGTGSLSFGTSFPFSSLFVGMQWPGMGQFAGPRFDMIDNPRQVYQLIRDAQKNVA